MDIFDKINQKAQESMQQAAQATEQKEEVKVEQTAAPEAAKEKVKKEPEKTEAAKEQQTTEHIEQKAEAQEITVDDNLVLKYLRENRGIEIESLDTIGKPAELSFASPEVEQFNIFAQETGRGLNDYLSTQKDWNEASDEEVARAYYLQKNQSMTREDFTDEYDLDLKPLEGDDYTDAEIQARDKEIRRRDRHLKQLANEGKKYFSDMQAKLKTPKEKQESANTATEEARKLWKSNVEQTAQSFDLGISGYKHDVSAAELTERYSSLDKVTNLFKDASGNFDANKMMTIIERGLAYDKISKVLSEQAQTQTKEDVLKELENPSGISKSEGQTFKETDPGVEHAKGIFRQHFGIR